jgi:GT2 family glycosyltransferase
VAEQVKKIFQAKTIQDDLYARYPVDILIPFYGQYQRVYKLCEAIWRGLRLYYNYHLFLIDDCSPNQHFLQGFSKAPRTSGIRNERQLGFGGAVNVGLQHTKSPWVVVMHSDCMPQDQTWLPELMKAMEELQSQRVVMVSPRTNEPGEMAPGGLQGTKGDFAPNEVLKEGFLPLYCTLFPRSLLTTIGGLLKPYPLGWYENEELSYRLKKFGYAQGIAGKSWIYHTGEATFKDVWANNPDAKNIMESNYNRCLNDIRQLG